MLLVATACDIIMQHALWRHKNSVNIFFIFLFVLLQPQFLTDFHKQGAIL